MEEYRNKHLITLRIINEYIEPFHPGRDTTQSIEDFLSVGDIMLRVLKDNKCSEDNRTYCRYIKT